MWNKRRHVDYICFWHSNLSIYLSHNTQLFLHLNLPKTVLILTIPRSDNSYLCFHSAWDILIKFSFTWSYPMWINLTWTHLLTENVLSVFCIWGLFWKWGGSFSLCCASCVFSMSAQLHCSLCSTLTRALPPWVWLEEDWGHKYHLSQVTKAVASVNSICSCECLDVLATGGILTISAWSTSEFGECISSAVLPEFL